HRYAKAFRVRRRYKNIESRIKLRRIVDPIEPKKIVRNAENGGEPFKFAAKCFVERIVFTRDQKPRIRMFFECFVCRENEFALALYLQKFADRSDERHVIRNFMKRAEFAAKLFAFGIEPMCRIYSVRYRPDLFRGERAF